MTQKTKLPIWYLEGPFFRYEQDVKAEAAKAGVRIIDANVTASRKNEAKSVPKVTLKPEYRAKGKSEGAKKGGQAKPSEGLDEAALKAALAAKGIAIPEGAKPEELATLLDGAKD